MRKISNAVAKNIKRYDETGSHEDRHRKGRPRVTSSSDDMFIRVTSLRNCNPNKCLIVQLTNTFQHQLFRRDSVNQGLHGRIAAKKPLLKDTNKKRLAWAKKHKKLTLDQWKSVLWSDESKFEIFDSNHCVFVTQSR